MYVCDGLAAVRSTTRVSKVIKCNQFAHEGEKHYLLFFISNPRY